MESDFLYSKHHLKLCRGIFGVEKEQASKTLGEEICRVLQWPAATLLVVASACPRRASPHIPLPPAT